jgi:hypothetical protein
MRTFTCRSTFLYGRNCVYFILAYSVPDFFARPKKQFRGRLLYALENYALKEAKKSPSKNVSRKL